MTVVVVMMMMRSTHSWESALAGGACRPHQAWPSGHFGVFHFPASFVILPSQQPTESAEENCYARACLSCGSRAKSPVRWLRGIICSISQVSSRSRFPIFCTDLQEVEWMDIEPDTTQTPGPTLGVRAAGSISLSTQQGILVVSELGSHCPTTTRVTASSPIPVT
uniref:Putative secreted protein n=1 Tax=Anopheles darlingi TaxID=43151 RepID=A0A2M4DBB9_ANODA